MTKPKRALRAILREPLLHFLLLGAVIFAVDAVANPASKQAHVIAVTADLRRDLTAQFEEKQRRSPSPAELETLIDTWVTNEILYREAQALGLDKGDEMIRERITHKMRLIIFNNLIVNDPTEDELQAWFAVHRDRYDIPQRFDFFDVRVAGADAAGQRQAEDALHAIRSESETDELRGKVRVYRSRSATSVDQTFGIGFAQSLTHQPLKTWSAVSAADGWHIVRVDGISPAAPAEFEQVRDQVDEEWRQERVRELARSAVKQLGAKYTIQRQDSP